VAWLLPNTEKWFKKWMTEFTRMLFIYPAVMFVWGASQFLSHILSQQASVGNFITVCLLAIVPVVAIIPIFKMGGQALGAMQNLTQRGLKASKVGDLADAGGRAVRRGAKTGFGTTGGKFKSGRFGQTRLGRMTSGLGSAVKWGSERPEKIGAWSKARDKSEEFRLEEIQNEQNLKRAEAIQKNKYATDREKDWARDGLVADSKRKVDRATTALDTAGYMSDGDMLQAIAMGEGRLKQSFESGDMSEDKYNRLSGKLTQAKLAGLTSEHHQRAAINQTHMFNGEATSQILQSFSSGADLGGNVHGTSVGADDVRAAGLSKLAVDNKGKIGLKGAQLGAAGQGSPTNMEQARLSNISGVDGSKIEAGDFAQMDADQMSAYLSTAKKAAESTDADIRARGQQALQNLAKVQASIENDATLKSKFVGTSRDAAYAELSRIAATESEAGAPTPPEAPGPTGPEPGPPDLDPGSRPGPVAPQSPIVWPTSEDIDKYGGGGRIR
jgi:hypothetical protein